MKHLLIGALAGLIAVPLFLLGAFIALASGHAPVLWAYFLTTVFLWGAFFWRFQRSRGGGGVLLGVRHGTVSLLLAVIVGGLVAFFANLFLARPPRQEVLAASLREHREQFVTLRDMVREDRLESVIESGQAFSRFDAPGIFRPAREVGLTDERAARYRELMNSAGCRRIDVWPGGTIQFLMAAWGTANRGFRVSIAWADTEPSPLLGSIDGFPQNRAKGAPNFAYSRLDGSWYAYIIW